MTIHTPVLVNEALEALQVAPEGIYIDGTFGQGGHTFELLKKLNNKGRVLAIDKDPAAAAYVMNNFPKEERLKFHYNSFSEMKETVQRNNLYNKINGILLDLGTSATQLETPERGFSFQKDGPLDMRMNPSQKPSAFDWLSKASVCEMTSIFKSYGEERWSKRIAEAIYSKRKEQSIQTTTQLAEIIKEAHPRWPRKIHPATRVFQAIRIHVNREMEELKECLRQSVEVLAPKGRLAVITFHSLEAQVVKQFMRKMVQSTENQRPMRWIDTNIKPTRAEILNNPRARSAILRVMEKNHEYN